MTTASSQILPGSSATDFTATAFIVAAALAEMQTVSVCEVMAVNTGAQTVDVKVLVNLMTAAGQSIPHGVISARPYFRLQGGSNAIICDPGVGDIGTIVFASRDLSGVIANKGAANPGSQRQFDWADGIYFGGILNGTPTQYVQFATAGGGINIVSPGTVAIQAPATTASGTLNVTGDTTLQATLAVTGASTLTGAVTAPGGITTTTIAGASAVFSGSVTASSFIGGGGGGGGTVTSIGISTPGVGVTVGGGPITTAGTLTVDLSSTAYAALALAVTALQSISIATGTGLTGGPLAASGSTVSLSSASIASLALASTAVQPGAIQFIEAAGWNATSAAVVPALTVPQDILIPYGCTLQEVYITTQGANGTSVTGNCIVTLQTAAFPTPPATDITAGVPPAISGASSYSNTTLTSWTKTFAQGALIRATLTANSNFYSVKIHLRFA